MKAESHFYIWVCCAEWKPALARERLEISHLKALLAFHSLNILLSGVKGHQLSKQSPNYTAGEAKQNGNSEFTY